MLTPVGSLVGALLLAQASPESAALPSTGADQIVTVARISVEGSRFELRSVERLSGLRPGQKINEAILRTAIQRMLDAGLTKNVEYYYESAGEPGSVALTLKVTDEAPLLPATIELPDVDSEDVWTYLKTIDPLFTRELPRTQKAIAFYARYMERYLAMLKRTGHVASVITADENGNAKGIVFVPADLLGAPQFRGPSAKARKGARDANPASPGASRPSAGDPPAGR